MASGRRTAKYIEIATYLRILIARKKLRKGNQLPTELQLCRQFHCSRTTVRQAFEVLVRDGEIHRQRGAGTFVADEVTAANSMLIAAIVPNMVNAEMARFTKILGTAASEKGYILLLGVTNDDPEIEQQFIAKIAALKVSGVLKFPTNIELEEETRGHLRKYGIPYIVANDFWTDCRQDYSISYDECAAVEMAVDHLAKLGHRRIAMLDQIPWARTRADDAFLRCLARHGLPHEQNHLLNYDLGRRMPPIEKLYGEGGPSPTGIITVFDVSAAQLLTQLRKIEMRVPEDVSVVNLNGQPVELPMEIDLTTAIPPNKEMVEQVLHLFGSGLDEGHVQHFTYRPAFHVGLSSGPCKESGQASGSAHAQQGTEAL